MGYPVFSTVLEDPAFSSDGFQNPWEALQVYRNKQSDSSQPPLRLDLHVDPSGRLITSGSEISGIILLLRSIRYQKPLEDLLETPLCHKEPAKGKKCFYLSEATVPFAVRVGGATF